MLLFDNRRFVKPLQQYKTLNSAAGGLPPHPPKKMSMFLINIQTKFLGKHVEKNLSESNILSIPSLIVLFECSF